MYLFIPSGVEFFETSAKENINVEIVFDRLVNLICDKMAKTLDAPAAVKGPNYANPQLTSREGNAALPNLSAKCQQC